MLTLAEIILYFNVLILYFNCFLIKVGTVFFSFPSQFLGTNDAQISKGKIY